MKWILVVLAVLAVVFLQLKPGKVELKLNPADGLYYKAGETNIYTGLGKVYHANGAKAQEGQISEGKPNGPWKQWHTNGQLHWEGSYNDGKQDGAWVRYDEAGKKVEEVTFVDGMKQGPAAPAVTQTPDKKDSTSASAEALETKKEPNKE